MHHLVVLRVCDVATPVTSE